MNCADACLKEMKIYIGFLQGLNLRSFVDLVQCTSTDTPGSDEHRTPLNRSIVGERKDMIATSTSSLSVHYQLNYSDEFWRKIWLFYVPVLYVQDLIVWRILRISMTTKCLQTAFLPQDWNTGLFPILETLGKFSLYLDSKARVSKL